jgi:hypothetical protein
MKYEFGIRDPDKKLFPDPGYVTLLTTSKAHLRSSAFCLRFMRERLLKMKAILSCSCSSGAFASSSS